MSLSSYPQTSTCKPWHVHVIFKFLKERAGLHAEPVMWCPATPAQQLQEVETRRKINNFHVLLHASTSQVPICQHI